jgi:hypothetical protein
MLMNKKKKEKAETPISNGDTRPDKPIDPKAEKKKKNKEGSADEKKFTSERLSDLNSLEDYKDAK